MNAEPLLEGANGVEGRFAIKVYLLKRNISLAAWTRIDRS